MAAADASMAGLLGVGTSIITAFRRELLLGLHWQQDGTGKVSYTDEGKARLREMVHALAAPNDVQELPTAGLPLQPKSRAFTLWTIEEPTPQPDRMLTIVRCHANTRYVRVRTPDNTLADVRVENGARLRPRLQIRCRLLADGRWECRHPGFAAALRPLQKKEGAAG